MFRTAGSIRFMTREFLALSHAEQIEFCMSLTGPRLPGRISATCDCGHGWQKMRPYSVPLVWLAWSEIFDEVARRFKPGAPDGCRSHPTDPESLKIQWRDFAMKHGLNDPPRISPPMALGKAGLQFFPNCLIFRCLISYSQNKCKVSLLFPSLTLRFPATDFVIMRSVSCVFSRANVRMQFRAGKVKGLSCQSRS